MTLAASAARSAMELPRQGSLSRTHEINDSLVEGRAVCHPRHLRVTIPRSAALLALALLSCHVKHASGGSPRLRESDAPSAPIATPVGQGAFVIPKPTLRVLFIGNSLTGANDLPGTVAMLGQSVSSPVTFVVDSRTSGGQTWEGHDADPVVDELIARGWDYVVLQDQSDQWSTNGVKPALLSLDARIKAAGAKTILFMTWPNFGEEVFGNLLLVRYYQRHAEAAAATVAPVGRAWERAARVLGAAAYAADQHHPSVLGTYLTACVIYEALTGASPMGLDVGGVFDSDATTVQKIAHETVLSQKRLPPPLLGEWPLSGDALVSDLALSTDLQLGAVTRGDGTRATQFGQGRYAAIPYARSLEPPTATLTLDMGREDWAIDGGEYIFGSLIPVESTDPITVDDPHIDGFGYGIYQVGKTLWVLAQTTEAPDGVHLAHELTNVSSGWLRLTLRYDGTTLDLVLNEVLEATTPLSGDLTTAPDYQYGSLFIGGTRGSNGSAVVNGHDYELGQFTGAMANVCLYGGAEGATTSRAR